MENTSIIEDKYRTWLGTPERLRPAGLRTKKQFAEKLDVELNTLITWEMQPRFWDDVFARARSIIGGEMTIIMEALLERAASGSVQAIKLCLDLLGVHSDNLEIKHTYDDDQLVLVYGDQSLLKEMDK